MTPKKILIVEDEMVIAANLSLQLTSFGYEITGLLPRGEQVIANMQETPPDIVLLDINLKGELDGIAVGQLIQAKQPTPIIYLTSNSDDATFERAKSTNPYAFLSKPFKNRDLKRTIELAVNRIAEENQPSKILPETVDENPFILTDRIFVRHKDTMVKLFIKDILYIEAERNYSRIFAKDKEYLLTMTLKTMEEKLPIAHFLRIHRSFIINLTQIDAVSDGYVVINRKAIPLSKTQKEELLARVKLL